MRMTFKRTSTTLTWLITVLSMVISLLSMSEHIATAREMVAHPVSTDFYKFYISGIRLQSNKSMYWQYDKNANTDCHTSGPTNCFNQTYLGLHPNLNSPAFAPVALSLANLTYETSWWAWFITSIICIYLTSLIIASHISINSKSKIYSLWIFSGIISAYPTHISLSLGQVTPFLMILTAGMLQSYLKGSKAASGFFLGTLICLKPFFGLLFIPLFARHDHKTLACAFSTILVIGMTTALWLGGNAYIDFSQAVQSITWSASNWNASLFGWLSRILGGSENRPLINAPQIGIALYGALSIAIAAILFSTNFRKGRADPLADESAHHLTSTLPCMLFLAPLGWVYYFPLLAFCIPSLLEMRQSRTQSALICFFIGVCMLPMALIPAEDINDVTMQLLEASIYFYALTALMVVLLAYPRNRTTTTFGPGA